MEKSVDVKFNYGEEDDELRISGSQPPVSRRSQ
jgi:hypothetical protein